MILRGWNDEDVQAWALMNADPRVRRFYPGTEPVEKSIADATGWRGNVDREGYGWFVAEVKGVMPFAGAIFLAPVAFDAPFVPANEVGWRFRTEAWGHGYATEAARAALDYAAQELGWHGVVAFTAEINIPSRRVMERLGMAHDPAEDFDHPRLPEGHRLRRHVLYRS